MTQEQVASGSTNADDKERVPSPPYISFLTFSNFLTWVEGEGIPHRFDRSFWDKKFAGSTGVQLMTGLRFLNLLKGDIPQPELEKIVAAKGDDKKVLLSNVIRQAYSKIDFQQLERATPMMLADWLRSYGIDGDTLRKAESFFINACKAYEISLSKPLQKKARNRPAKASGAKPIRKRIDEKPLPLMDKGLSEKPPVIPPDDTGNQPKGQISNVTLVSGGEVTLVLNVNLFELSKEDRGFVLELVDKIKAYTDKKE